MQEQDTIWEDTKESSANNAYGLWEYALNAMVQDSNIMGKFVNAKCINIDSFYTHLEIHFSYIQY